MIHKHLVSNIFGDSLSALHKIITMWSYLQLTKDSSSLKRRYQDGNLQFKDCSLSSIAYTERFLWVQHLDLSNNHLRSVHGTCFSQLWVVYE